MHLAHLLVFHAKVAETTNNPHETGFSRDIVYKRIYDIKKKGVNMVEKSTPKKRKVVTDADENS